MTEKGENANPFLVIRVPHNSKSTERPGQLKGLIALLQYLVTLRREGTIDDEVFSELVRYSSSAFIEAELSQKIAKVLTKTKPPNVFLVDFLK